jgi:dTDP-4-dehydrorhamnose reductase
MRVLIFGSTGQVAQALRHAQWAKGTTLIFLDRRAADFVQPESLGAVVRAQAPDAVVIAAAYTAVDAAEANEGTAYRVNAEAPGAIGLAADALSAPVVHLSTDYVFDGAKAEPYTEADASHPVNAYGRTKLAGEVAIRAANPRHLILRTSWLYSATGANFLLTMLRLARQGAEVRVVSDQVGCPTAADDLAAAIAKAVTRLVNNTAPFGLFHVTGDDTTSWHGFAEAIFSELQARGLRRPRNVAIPTSEFPTPARRPLNSQLSCARFAEAFGIRLPGFQSSLPAIIGRVLKKPPAAAESEAS